MEKWHGLICQKIQAKLEEYKVQAKYCIPKWARGIKYQIHCMQGDQYTVNLDDCTCSFGRWDLSGVPYPNVICVVYFNEDEHDNYVTSDVVLKFIRRYMSTYLISLMELTCGLPVLYLLFCPYCTITSQ